MQLQTTHFQKDNAKVTINETVTEEESGKWQAQDTSTVNNTNTSAEENSDIVKRAKSMSHMTYCMHQFTKGHGPLKTTQDLFTQAEYFAEEANRLYKVIRQFSYQVGCDLQISVLIRNFTVIAIIDIVMSIFNWFTGAGRVA